MTLAAVRAAPRRAADAPHPVFVRSFEYPQGYPGFAHRHRLAQIAYPLRGAVTVETEAGTWSVTTPSAVAIPAWCRHRVAAHGNASLRSVFVDPDVYPDLVPALTTLRISTLLHELIREAGRYYTDFDEGDAVALAVVTLIAQLVPAMEIAPRSTFVPGVEHPLLVPAAAAVHADPAAPARVEQFARAAGVSPRHFSRLFKAETGVSFTTWRALVQVQHALVQLARGESVTRVGMDLGYSSTSAFIEMFKRHTGRTPGQSA